MLDTLFSQLFGHAAQQIPVNDPETQQAVRILARLQQHLFGRWRFAQRTMVPCSVRFRRPGGGQLRCTEPMIGACSVCRNPACMTHAAVTLDAGEVICFGCIELARQAAMAGGAKGPGQASMPTEDEEKQRQKFLRRLKLKDSPSEAEVQAAFRKEAAKAHPDRFTTDADRAKAHKRFVMLGEARDWLLKDLEKRKAKAA